MHPQYTMLFQQRFWAKIKKTDSCWLWHGWLHGNGYGGTQPERSQGSRHLLTHRVAYELTYGPIPEGMQVCHSCDVNYPPGDITYRRCVRPDHLFLGTQADNVKDCIQKGRQGDHRPRNPARGAASYAAKLSDEKVMAIRTEYAAGGISQAELGRRFNICQSAILKIVKGLRWTHLPVIDYGSRNNRAYSPAIGEGHGRHKLAMSQVLAIRQSTGTNASIARQYGVCAATVSGIKTGKHWARAIREHEDTSSLQRF